MLFKPVIWNPGKDYIYCGIAYEIRSLRVSSQLFLTVPWSQLKMNCDCAFPVTAHSTWNSLPEDLKYASSVFLFKSYLKTYIYSMAFGNDWLDCFMCMYVWFVCVPFHITVPMATNAMWSCLFWFFFFCTFCIFIGLLTICVHLFYVSPWLGCLCITCCFLVQYHCKVLSCFLCF